MFIVLEEPVFVAALDFRMTRLGDNKKNYAPLPEFRIRVNWKSEFFSDKTSEHTLRSLKVTLQ